MELVDPNDSGSYKILRTLPGYSVGNSLREEERILYYSKEATVYAVDKLRSGNYAFVKQSDGSFTYAIYDGHEKGDPSHMLFGVNDRGDSKRFRANATRMMVPVIPAALMGNAALVAKYDAALVAKYDAPLW